MSINFKSLSTIVSHLQKTSASKNTQAFLNKQLRDVELYGVKHYRDGNVPVEVIEKYTPFRRLSKKPCSLSDSKYFIDKFEKENSSEIPKLWNKMADNQKVDFIVKNRYEKLVSNKIMNNIKSSRVEESFGLTTDGQIRHYGTLNSSRHCPSPEDKNLISIHNHPLQFGGEYSNSVYAEINQSFHPFSGGDILNSLKRPKTYVVDMHGNKYCLIPNKNLQNPYTIDNYIDDLAGDFSNITKSNMDKYSNLSEAVKYSRLGYIERVKKDGHDFKQLNLF